MRDFKNKIEALLFSSGRLMDKDSLMQLIGIPDEKTVEDSVAILKEEYETRGSPLMLVEERNGWKLTVREKYLPLVRKIVSNTELPKTVLETLAVIAWKAPVQQSDIVDIRHNKAYDHISLLEEWGFLSKERHGRTYMLKLTNKFFEYFDIDSKLGIREVFQGAEEKAKETVEINERKRREREACSRQKHEQLFEERQRKLPSEHLGRLEVYSAGKEEEQTAPPLEDAQDSDQEKNSVKYTADEHDAMQKDSFGEEPDSQEKSVHDPSMDTKGDEVFIQEDSTKEETADLYKEGPL